MEISWNSHKSVPILSQTLTLHCFCQLRTAIHFTKNDDYNTNYRFWKVRYVFEAVRHECYFCEKIVISIIRLRIMLFKNF